MSQNVRDGLLNGRFLSGEATVSFVLKHGMQKSRCSAVGRCRVRIHNRDFWRVSYWKDLDVPPLVCDKLATGERRWRGRHGYVH